MAANLTISLPEATSAKLDDSLELAGHPSPSSYISELIDRNHAEQMRFIVEKLNETIGSESVELTEEELDSDDYLEIAQAKFRQLKQQSAQ